MRQHLWTFPLPLILCHDDVGHHKEGVFVLKTKEEESLWIFKFSSLTLRTLRTLRAGLLPARARCSPPRPRPRPRPRAGGPGRHPSPWWWQSSPPGQTPGTSCSRASWCCNTKLSLQQIQPHAWVTDWRHGDCFVFYSSLTHVRQERSGSGLRLISADHVLH